MRSNSVECDVCKKLETSVIAKKDWFALGDEDMNLVMFTGSKMVAQFINPIDLCSKKCVQQWLKQIGKTWTGEAQNESNSS